MSENNHSNIINLSGEIIGIYEKEGSRFAKVYYETGFVDVTIQYDKDFYLGDKVIINSNLTIKKITHKSEEENIK